MNYAYIEVGLQEIPDEISLCIGFSGCTLHCPGCHSKELWNADYGAPMTVRWFDTILKRYQDKCSCFCALGGEWCQEELITYLQMARKMGYKTALYTGENWVGDDLRKELDYLKLYPYIAELGGLSEKTTNQRMYKIDNGVMEDITSSFWR